MRVEQLETQVKMEF